MAFKRQDLVFREVEPSDLPLLRDHRNDPESWIGLRDPYPVMTSRNQLDWYNNLSRSNMAFVVVDDTLPADDRVGLLRISQLDLTNRSAGITGVDVFKNHRGHGYATKIVRGGAEYLIEELGFHRVWGQATAENLPMQKAMLRAGYQLEATFRSYIWRGNQWHDFLQFSILAEEL
jgi:RimJ/RimL family protein N-acetyltransferase